MRNDLRTTLVLPSGSFLMCCKRRVSSYTMPFSDDLPAVLLEEGLLSNDLDAVLLVKSDLAS